jgi:hypothetical protein
MDISQRIGERIHVPLDTLVEDYTNATDRLERSLLKLLVDAKHDYEYNKSMIMKQREEQEKIDNIELNIDDDFEDDYNDYNDLFDSDPNHGRGEYETIWNTVKDDKYDDIIKGDNMNNRMMERLNSEIGIKLDDVDNQRIIKPFGNSSDSDEYANIDDPYEQRTNELRELRKKF